MALTVTTDLTLVCDGSSGQDSYWSGEDGVSTEVYQQGTSSQSWVVGKNSSETAVFDYYTANSNTAADVSATDTHLYMHVRCDIAPFIDYFKVRLTDGSSNYSEWDVVDNTTATEWYGEWKTFVVDLSSTPDATSGTLSQTDVRTFSFNVDNSNSGNIRSIENTYIDVVRFGTGITAYDNSATTAFDFTDIEAIANNSTNKYGIMEKIGGVIFMRGRLTVGESTGTYDSVFTSKNETVVWLAPSVSGESMSSGLYQFNVKGNSTGTNTFTIGTAVGTGDDQIGRDGSVLTAESGSSKVDVNVQTSSLSMNLYGGIFRGLGGTFTCNALFLSGLIVSGCTFDGLDQVLLGRTIIIRNCTFLNTVAPSTSGAFKFTNESNIKYCLFVNNLRAIEIASTSSDLTFTGMEFTGNTYDVRYEGTTDWDINWSEATGSPTIENFSTGTLTAVNSVTLTIYNCVIGARIYIEAKSGGDLTAGDQIKNEVVSGSTTWTSSFAFTNSQPVLVRARYASVPGSEKIPWEQDASIESSGMSLSAQLLDDY